MTEEQFQQLIGILGEMGSAAYQAALVRAYVWNLVAIVFNSGCLVALVVAAKKLRAYFSDKDDDELDVMKFGACAIFGLLFLVFGNFAATNVVNLLSPQYTALEYLARLVTRS